jgi:two-component system phosphate regulon sensor histidine kinase PhoR
LALVPTTISGTDRAAAVRSQGFNPFVRHESVPMNLRSASIVLLAAASVLSLAFVLAWPPSWWLSSAWPVRLGLLGAGIALAGTAVALLLRDRAAQLDAAQQLLQSLCELDFRDSTPESLEVELPTLPSNHRLAQTIQHVQATFLDQCQQLQDSEHARASLEIRARRSALESERISTVVDCLQEPVLAIDDYDELVLANPSAKRLFHLNGETAEKRALATAVQCSKLVEILTETRRRKGTATRTEEIELPDADGGKHWYSITASNLEPVDEGDSKSSRGAVAVLRDISSQKALQKRNAEFVSAVSHEMKTPLAGIKAYVELLADDEAEDDKAREEFLDVINTQADRLQRLIDNLLNLSRIEAGVAKVNKRTMALNEILEEALRVLQPAAEQKQIRLSGDLSPMYLGVYVDRDTMLQAAINLLSNAIKYTPAGGKVTLRSRMADQEILFEVEDSGVGLSEEDCQKVFEKFYRVKKDSDMAPGTGLGLPLVRHIIADVHNGRVEVQSKLGEGSTFRVVLPPAGSLS